MEDADSLELAFLIQIVKNALVQNADIALLPGAVGALRRIAENMELGDQLHKELVPPGYEGAHIQHFADVGGKGFVVGNELLRAVDRFSGYAGYLGALEVIRILHGDIRAEIAGDLIKPFAVEMIGIYQELFTVHKLLPPSIDYG
jgi:hypothetical protein